MKTRLLSVVGILVISVVTLSAQTEKKEKFLVAGECGMCKSRIEKAAVAVEGVVAAEWNQENKMLEVTLSGEQVEINDVHKAVAAVGHDTKLYKAGDAVYDKLPACCKYERLPVEKEKK
ncbi:MAG: cation transporter [Bacteroidales bacterium]